MKRKAVLSLLVLVILCLLCAMPAMAADDHSHEGWTPFTITGGAVEKGNYYLTEDVALTDKLTITEAPDSPVVICLNGHTLSRDLSTVIGARHLAVYRTANLTICDCTETEHVGYIDAETGLWKEGAAPANEPVVTLKGGIIGGGRYEYGAVAYLTGTLTLKNVNVAGNYSDVGTGGAIHLALSDNGVDKGRLYTENVTFVGNVTTSSGGAIFGVGSTVAELKDSTFLYNKAVQGGGAIHTSGNLTVTGGTFEHNISSTAAGLYISGNATLGGNLVCREPINVSKGKPIVGGTYLNPDGRVMDVSSFVAYGCTQDAATGTVTGEPKPEPAAPPAAAPTVPSVPSAPSSSGNSSVVIDNGGGMSVGVIIGIAAAAVVICVVAIVVIKKKKK